jgi:MEMO1 family protein
MSGLFYSRLTDKRTNKHISGGSMIRKPAVAGAFYSASPSQLEATIRSMVQPGAAREKVVGLVCPHAGYPYSGHVAGVTISRIQFKNTFIILGPNHTGQGVPFSIMTEGEWQTPLGNVAVNSNLAKGLLSASSYLEEDTAAHRAEHSIEVQLPFLQYFKHDVQIVPVVLGPSDGESYKALGEEIAAYLRQSGQEAVILASSDMTHYESQEAASRKDKMAIEAILKLDAGLLIRRIEEYNITMCGYGPVLTLISAAKSLGAKRAELVRYQTSGDVTGDYKAVVGYAGIIIPEEAAK